VIQGLSSDRVRFLLLVAITATVAIAATWISMLFLYWTSFDEQRTWLVKLVQSQTWTFEAIASLETQSILPGANRVTRSDLINYVRETHLASKHFGKGVEFVLVERQDDKIVFLMSHRDGRHIAPPPIAYDRKDAEVERRAVNGDMGSMVGMDFRGRRVVAAYEPIMSAGVGLVGKIDVAVIQEPFIRAGMVAGMSAVMLILLGAFFFWNINNESAAELQQTLLERDAANRSKSEFLTNMSHELRSPLTAIIGYAEVMKNEMLGPLNSDKYREYVDGIFVSGHHLHNLINDILDISAIEAGRLNLNDDAVAIEDAAREAIRLAAGWAEAAGITLISRIDPNIQPIIADERRVVQMLVNLLTNAIKFSERGSEVCLAARLGQDGKLTVSVEDSGIGMTSVQLERALMNFGQVANVNVNDQEGTGLGLPLTKGLIEAHQGTMDIESRYGEGTKVTLRFPKERLVA